VCRFCLGNKRSGIPTNLKWEVGHKADFIIYGIYVRKELYGNKKVKNPDVLAISLGEEIQITVAF
jgi:hypothetical protein